jgi:hypothetical protein
MQERDVFIHLNHMILSHGKWNNEVEYFFFL